MWRKFAADLEEGGLDKSPMAADVDPDGTGGHNIGMLQHGNACGGNLQQI
jgi:hypothetical protein